MIKKVFILLNISLFTLLCSCTNNDFDIGSTLFTPSTRTIKTDTFSLKLSVLAKDSIITSSQNVAYVGRYNDPYIGVSTASSFIEFSKFNPSGQYPKPGEYDRFDSVTLVLTPTGNYYGDTIPHPSIKISELISKIEYDDENKALYSTSSVPVGNMLVDKVYKINVANKKEVEIRLPDAFGEKLFLGIRDDAIEMDPENYLETFPGLALEPGNNPGTSIYNYLVTDTACMVRIYYRRTGNNELEADTMNFTANTSKHFYNYRTSLKNNLPDNSKDDPIPTSQTGNMGFVSSAPLLYTRIEFPSLNNLLPLGEIIVIESAKLIIRPVYNTYDTVPLPPQLFLYLHDPLNDSRNTTALQDAGGSTMNGNLSGKNKFDRENYYYDFDLSSFIYDQVGKDGYYKYALSLDVPDVASSKFQRFIFGDQHFFYKNDGQSKENQISLEITYSIYNEYQ
ncbi:MAG: DUF4270 domain-containing protein [Bacteroidales bacterium]|jgi:hypothetical protein|nr:DUF4270 domain-containing protein [Bacteroidales bacterium]